MLKKLQCIVKLICHRQIKTVLLHSVPDDLATAWSINFNLKKL